MSHLESLKVTRGVWSKKGKIVSDIKSKTNLIWKVLQNHRRQEKTCQNSKDRRNKLNRSITSKIWIKMHRSHKMMTNGRCSNKHRLLKRAVRQAKRSTIQIKRKCSPSSWASTCISGRTTTFSSKLSRI